MVVSSGKSDEQNVRLPCVSSSVNGKRCIDFAVSVADRLIYLDRFMTKDDNKVVEMGAGISTIAAACSGLKQLQRRPDISLKMTGLVYCATVYTNFTVRLCHTEFLC